jgi:hypothetical protein
MVADYERTRDALVRLVGLNVLEDSRVDDPAIGRRGGMAWLGDNVIENQHSSAAPSTGSSDGSART